MRFLLDENFPFSAVAFLRERGHEVFTLEETCGRGAFDEDVFASAQALGAVLLTSDRDFYHTIPHLHPRHRGIVVVALRQPSRDAILSRLGWFLSHIPPPHDNLAYILRDHTYRYTPAE
jgi:predicted nuclease of predicted toxin-antitoxin system